MLIFNEHLLKYIFSITVYYDALIVLWSVPTSKNNEKYKMKLLKYFCIFCHSEARQIRYLEGRWIKEF